jgi:hypothetical protein
MVLKGPIFGEITVPGGLEKHREALRANEVWSHDLVPWANPDVVRDEVQQSRGIDHVAGHIGTLGFPVRTALVSSSALNRGG